MYDIGTDFEREGMIVTATYTNGDSHEVTGYVVENDTDLQAGTTYLPIRYTENGVTARTTVSISMNIHLIRIDAEGGKRNYYDGEAFSTAALIVTAYYDTGDSKILVEKTAGMSGYEITDPDRSALPKGKTFVTVSYTEGDVTATCKVNITVTNPLKSIAVTKSPALTQPSGQKFNPAGMEVTATYQNGKQMIIPPHTAAQNGYVLSSDNNLILKEGVNVITVGYTEDDVYKSTTVNVTGVNNASGSVTNLFSTKVINYGRVLRANEFTFVLTDSSGTELQRASNDSTGYVRWQAIDYTAQDINRVYVYYVHELTGTDDTVNYDTRIFAYQVTVTDAGNNHLETQVKSYLCNPDKTFKAESPAAFSNTVAEGYLTITAQAEMSDYNHNLPVQYKVVLTNPNIPDITLKEEAAVVAPN